MANLEAMVKEAFYLQNAMNSKVDERWVINGWNWNLAASQEFAEFIDHIGWKWWKKQDPDVEQAFIELVDIFHFYLSAVIEYEGIENCQEGEVIERIADVLTKEATPPADMPSQEIQVQWATKCINECTSEPLHDFPLTYLSFMYHELGYTAEDFLKTYIAKNTLNVFRQDFGYKEGTYQKIWRGEEDNVVMARIVDRQPELLEDTTKLMEILRSEYPG